MNYRSNNRPSKSYDARRVIALAVDVIRERGWVSVKAAQMNGDEPTKETVEFYYNEGRIPTDEAVVTASKAIEWALTLERVAGIKGVDSYEFRVVEAARLAASTTSLNKFLFGIACSIPAGYDRSLNRVDLEVIGANAGGIIEIMKKAASSKVKFPRITFKTEIGTLQFSLAGERSKNAGSVNITDGRKFGENVWYGRVSPEGNLVPSRACTTEVRNFVMKFAADPAGVGAAYGKNTGNCCFCMTEITTDSSLEVGYGPICAKNFGLPWGVKKAA